MTSVFYIKRRPRCRVEGCRKRNIAGYGWCRAHYVRWYRTGDPLPKWASRDERILSLVDDRGGPDACWPWTGQINKDGYGVFGKKPFGMAHRFVYTILTGRQIQFTMDHECHNLDAACVSGPACLHRRCCNPSHLVERPHGENTTRAALTRATCKRGHPRTEENIRLRADGTVRACRVCERERAGVRNPRGPYRKRTP